MGEKSRCVGTKVDSLEERKIKENVGDDVFWEYINFIRVNIKEEY